MDAVIIGKYRLHIENAHVILTHEAGICFDLSEYEITGLQYFLHSRLCQPEQEHKMFTYVHTNPARSNG